MVNTLLGKPLSKYSINAQCIEFCQIYLITFERIKKNHRNTQNFKVQKY